MHSATVFAVADGADRTLQSIFVNPQTPGIRPKAATSRGRGGKRAVNPQVASCGDGAVKGMRTGYAAGTRRICRWNQCHKVRLQGVHRNVMKVTNVRTSDIQTNGDAVYSLHWQSKMFKCYSERERERVHI